MISDCCGADSQGYEDQGLCPECMEHCEFIDEEDNELEVLMIKYDKLQVEHIKILREYTELLEKVTNE